MKFILIEDDPQSAVLLQPLLEKNFEATVVMVPTLQAAIELFDQPKANDQTDLIICDYHGKSRTLMRGLLEGCTEIPFIFIVTDGASIKDLADVEGSVVTEPVSRARLSTDLVKRITELKNMSLIGGDATQARIPASDKEARKAIIQNHEKMDALIANPSMEKEEGREEAAASLETVQNLSEKYGFTPEVQTLVSKTVSLTLKVIGTKPKLSGLMDSLKFHEGKYITSHSIMLAEISCALACKLNWNSAATFLKLTLAAYMHDMPLKRNDVAACKTLDEVRRLPDIKNDDVKAFQMHPSNAAEYARKFHEIPPDVDTIVVQHHERPDGTGFPRGLFYRHISPLGCLFIIAEDMLRYYLKQKEGATIAQFVIENYALYQTGVFRKVIKALET